MEVVFFPLHYAPDSLLFAIKSCLYSFLLAWFILPGLSFPFFPNILTPLGACLISTPLILAKALTFLTPWHRPIPPLSPWGQKEPQAVLWCIP